MLAGKKILLGVSGSIAAYKSALLVRLLIKEGAEVKVVMTDNAKHFITPLTLSALSGNLVLDSVTDGKSWNDHVSAGLWADIMIVAPATATTLASMACGYANNMLVACYLAAKCPVYIAPAMDLDMWKHGSTKNNISTLQSFGNTIIPVGDGFLASGLYGEGRMAEPEEILAFIKKRLALGTPLKGKNILITAGPTFENIDPVRYIGNRSSGKMGIEIANRAVALGGNVSLVLGPSHVNASNVGQVIRVESASEMAEAVDRLKENSDIFVFTAAVADYRPATVQTEKIKKLEEQFTITLQKNKDIALSVGQNKRANQVSVGFALETDNAKENALKKIESKNFDLIVLNSLEDKGAGFQYDTNKVTIIFKNGKEHHFELKTKREVAEDIWQSIIEYINSNK